MDEFLIWLLESAGCDPANYRSQPLQRRLPACLRALRVGNTWEARKLLACRPSLLPVALSAVMLGVTGFFRDDQVFDHLRDAVLPSLLEHTPSLRVWSAACSDGPELYSIAMLLVESGALDRSYLLGSDCRVDAVSKAVSGRFDTATLEGLPPRMREKYFIRDQEDHVAVPALRSRIRWETRDLFSPGPYGKWDLILWRNVAIYLQAEAAEKIWKRLADALHPGGVLVVGKTERPTVSVPLVRTHKCFYRKI